MFGFMVNRMSEKHFVYMDHAATTYVRKDVLDAMVPYFTENFGNPSSLYHIARDSKNAIDTARKQVSRAIGSEPDEIFLLPVGVNPITGRSKVSHMRTGRRVTTSSRQRSNTTPR